jgi:hypothetical protein
VGWTADGGFDISNIPGDWKELFKSIGLTKHDLQENSSLAKEVFEIMNNANALPRPPVPRAPDPYAARGWCCPAPTSATPTSPRQQQQYCSPAPAPALGQCQQFRAAQFILGRRQEGRRVATRST